jgi:hypothetical protein
MRRSGARAPIGNHIQITDYFNLPGGMTMRRFSLSLAALLPAFALALMLAGCGKEEKKDTTTTGGGDTVGGVKKEVTVLEPKGGILKGKITIQNVPDLAALTKSLQEKMQEKEKKCLDGSETEKSEQEYRIGDNKQLGNVFVWIKPDAGTFFKVEESQLKALPKTVEIKQPHCAFIPHSLFLFTQYHADPKKPKASTPTGQVLKIVNNAEFSHNTSYKGDVNSGRNFILPKGDSKTVENLEPEAAQVLVKCDIHPWMNAYIRVVDTPYYAISLSDTLDGADKKEKTEANFGTYEIKNLPAGKVRVFAWHEKAGWLNKGEGKGEVIDIPAGKSVTKDFEAKAQ